MAKRKAEAKPAQQGVVDLGPSDELQVVSMSVPYVSINLSDGCVLKLRPIILDVRRSKRKFNSLGHPIYQIKHALVLETDPPKKLIRKAKGKAAK